MFFDFIDERLKVDVAAIATDDRCDFTPEVPLLMHRALVEMFEQVIVLFLVVV